ncbi:hypothetical protein CHS0354_006861 [Potamilus streckersoni]|uniref:polyribonucleotide nucleotidyltransferase n=1 Tax=Potamilus streckersoni TaxID=2493646 RepID=A0AAE0WD00_9BIVA|nr:hypothetical protein CHS0354_006861 [Potamilus streckersoni]
MKRVERTINNKKVILETGRIARQANGAVLVTYGETVVLVTVCASKDNIPDAPFFPLSCVYQMKYYAAGKIPGGFIMKFLTSRLIDRSVRPLFPDGYMAETILMATVMSYDEECPPEFASLLGASAALHISDIPFVKPIAGASVGYIDGKIVINPTTAQLENSDLNLFMSVAKDGVLMPMRVSEDVILDALKQGHEILMPFVEMQEELRELTGQEKRVIEVKKTDESITEEVIRFIEPKLKKALSETEKIPRYKALDTVKQEMLENSLIARILRLPN